MQLRKFFIIPLIAANGVAAFPLDRASHSCDKHLADPVPEGIISELGKRQWLAPSSTWDPPAELVKPLDEVWAHVVKTYPSTFRNYGWDQIMATNGTINYCVRWESSKSATEADRANIEAALVKGVNEWIKPWLAGYDNFPFTEIAVKVVGWAVSDQSKLTGSTAGLDVYTSKDRDGVPECATTCGRMYNQNGEYPNCKGGYDHHYDQSLWLTDGFSGGTGGDWGQRIATEYLLEEIRNKGTAHILLHEMGHTFGLDDFYDWTPSGQTKFVMKAGSAFEVTAFDGWMMRDWWRHLKARYQLPAEPFTPEGSGSTPSLEPAPVSTPTPSATPSPKPTSTRALTRPSKAPSPSGAPPLVPDEETASPVASEAPSGTPKPLPSASSSPRPGSPSSGQPTNAEIWNAIQRLFQWLRSNSAVSNGAGF